MAPLIQFRAGRCFREGETNTVTPAPGKGLIYIEEEDGLLHFFYKDLEANSIIDDLIIFPGDATFTKAAPRVHVLKFNSSSARSFFWHQDVDESQDDERAKKVNELIGGQVEEEEENSGAMEVEGAAGPAPVVPVASASSVSDPFTTPAPTRTAAPSAPVKSLGSEAQMAQLRDILAGISGGAGASSSALQGGMPDYLLTDVLPSSLLTSLLRSTPSLATTLLPYLPSEIPQTPESLDRAITSPEFKRSVASLDRALRTGALGPLVQGLGLGDESAMGVEAFLEGVVKQAEEKKEKEGEGEAKMETEE